MSKTKTKLTSPHIRWMIRRDMPEVLAIEQASFEFAWAEDDFIRCLRQRNCIGMLAEIPVAGQQFGPIVGYMLYELHMKRLHLLTLAVHPEFRKQGIGRQMVEKLINKLSSQRRSRITLEVRETNLEALLFFRRMGFKAMAVLKDFYEDTTEDAYLMQFTK